MTETWRGTSGIYEIVNAITGVRYVGSAQCLARRWSEHLAGLRAGRHHTARLQYAWDKYGESAFEFRVLAVLEIDQLRETEQRLLDQVYGQEGCCNAAPDAYSPMRGRKQSAPTIAKRAAALRGQKRSPESIARMSVAARGREKSTEHRAKLAAAMQARWADEGFRPGMEATLRAATSTPEAKAKSASKRRGQSLSPETRDKMSATHLRRWAAVSPEDKATHMARLHCPEVIEKIAAGQRGKKRPEHAVTMRAYWAMRKLQTK